MSEHNPPLHEAVARLHEIRRKVGSSYEFGRPLSIDLAQTWHDLEVVLSAAEAKAEESMVPAFQVHTDGVPGETFPFSDDPVSTSRATAMLAAQACVRACRAEYPQGNFAIQTVRVPDNQ